MALGMNSSSIGSTIHRSIEPGGQGLAGNVDRAVNVPCSPGGSGGEAHQGFLW